MTVGDCRMALAAWDLPDSEADSMFRCFASDSSYLIDAFESPVVEFQRSWTVSQMMLAGGIRADMNYLDSEKQDLAPKPAEFRKWFESIQNWIRKNFFHLTLLTYVGPGAEKFENEGGILH